LREKSVGDAVVWFVLNALAIKTDASPEEIWCLIQQPEFETLRAKVNKDTIRRTWRNSTRSEFLDKCKRRREKDEQVKAAKERERSAIRQRVGAYKRGMPPETDNIDNGAPAPNRPRHEHNRESIR